jgi:hypothetical protein
MKTVINTTVGSAPGHEPFHGTAVSPRTRSRGVATGPAVRPQKRRGRSRRDAHLEKRIEDLASLKSEFQGNLRKPAGLLDAFFELVDLMDPEFPATSPGPAAASPRRP